MLSVLANRTYRHLLAAQVVALVGTGLATVALGLLAYDLAGGNAGAVLGTALAIKMIAYVGVAPVVGAFADRLPRRAFLVAMDLIRAAVALLLPFVDQIWQVYVLIFVLQSASAAFTPTFQATIPDVLPDEKDYTNALSLSRLAYDLENLLSPMLAAALLTVISFHWLFSGTSIGFVASALLVITATLPRAAGAAAPRTGGIYARTTRGIRIYLATPRLRGLLAVTLAAAAGSAMVIVNTVVIVRGQLGLSSSDVAWALAAYGGGSILAAIALPRILERTSDRRVMTIAAMTLAVLLGAMAVFTAKPPAVGYWPVLLVGWLLTGIAYSCAVTPGGRLLRRSAEATDRPALFAAQFALSHVCWLVAYPLAGWLGASAGMAAAFAATGVLALIGAGTAILIWPSVDPTVMPHRHDDLPADHPHRAEHGNDHAHAYVIGDLHLRWPR